MSNKINDKDVELYLLKNTDFFLTRESIVGELNFKHSPGKAESLLERPVSYTHLTLPTSDLV